MIADMNLKVSLMESDVREVGREGRLFAGN